MFWLSRSDDSGGFFPTTSLIILCNVSDKSALATPFRIDSNVTFGESNNCSM